MDSGYVLNNNDFAIKETNSILTKTFARMFSGLLLTAIAAICTYRTNLIYVVINFYWLLAIGEIGLVLAFSFGFRKMSPTTVTILYYSYAIINGITLSTIFIVYQLGLIGKSFLITTALFGALALYGYTTEKDLTDFGNILMIALIIGLIATAINLFLKSSMFSIILDWVILFIFSGLTIYDMNKMKIMSDMIESDSATTEKVYVYCAMQLYLDFINIFLRILRILGRSNRN